MNLAFSDHLRSFEAQTRFLDLSLGSVMPKKDYKKLIKDECPTLYQREKRVWNANKEAIEAIDKWKKEADPPKVSAATPYDFPALSGSDKEAVESKASFHKTVAKVMMIAGTILLFAGIIGPLALLPLLLSLGETAAAWAVMTLTGVGTLGTGLAVASLFFGNTESIRIQRAKTDPNFRIFVERIVQHKRGANLNIAEEDLKDKALHNAFIAWREGSKAAKGMGEAFTQEKRKGVSVDLPKAVSLMNRQPELLAKATLEEIKKKNQALVISDDKANQAIARFKIESTPRVLAFASELFKEDGFKSEDEIQAFLIQEKKSFAQILETVLKT